MIIGGWEGGRVEETEWEGENGMEAGELTRGRGRDEGEGGKERWRGREMWRRRKVRR